MAARRDHCLARRHFFTRPVLSRAVEVREVVHRANGFVFQGHVKFIHLLCLVVVAQSTNFFKKYG